MKYIVSREEMQEIDRYSIEEIGIPGIVLMEKAAMAAVEEIEERYPSTSKIVILAEKGNNGGDGLAVGRILLQKGWQVDIFEMESALKPTPSYETQKKILKNLGYKMLSFSEKKEEEEKPEQSYDIVIDAIFGVGLKREVAGIQKTAVEWMNQLKGSKIALDVPTGIDATTGHILGASFFADITITFGCIKTGLVLYPGNHYAGETIVKEIGFPKKAVKVVSPKCFTYDEEDLVKLPQRKPWSNKGTYGKVLLIAGSKNMAGAAILCARAAYAAGCGLVRIFSCEENRIILQNQVPEAILTTYDNAEEAFLLLAECLDWATVTGIGPGIGRSPFSKALLTKVLLNGSCPLVIDADGLNSLASMRNAGKGQGYHHFEEYNAPVILTPHLKEMSTMTGDSLSNIQANLIQEAVRESDKDRIIVLKDTKTVVADGEGETYVNMSGNEGMAVGGSGDVLTGIICGFLAGGIKAVEAARLGVYCHGRSGDEAVKEKGSYGLQASDLIAYLPKVIH